MFKGFLILIFIIVSIYLTNNFTKVFKNYILQTRGTKMKSTFGKLLLIVFSIMFFVSVTNAADEPNGVTIQKNASSYKINFDLPDYDVTLVNAEGNNYIKLQIPGYGETSVPGLPLLPQVSFNLIIAYEEQAPGVSDIQITEGIRTLTNRIYPAQEPWVKTKPLSDRPFTINEEYYNSEGDTDAPFVVVSEPFIIAGVKGVRVSIYPFKYNPLKNELTYVTKGSFNIKLNHPIGMSITPTETLNSYLKSVFVKYEKSVNTKTTSNYLIITAPEYESGLSSFITHKTGLGYSVFVANTTATGTSNTAIKNYIQQRYNNMSTRPEFVLLVGDVDKIPEWIGTGAGSPHTDLNYGCLEGSDPYVDAFIGRFSVANSTDLVNIISKSIFMENNINGLPKKNIYMASNHNWTITEGTHNFVIDSFFAPAGYINLTLYSHSDTATTPRLIAALNDNQLFAIYSGHGSTTSWSDGPPLNQSQVNSLTNSVYPYVYSFACLTGSFHAAECFGETWIRTEHGGSVFWGSSVNSYWDEDDILEKRLFRAMFVDNLIKTAPMYAQGKIYLVNYYGNITSTMQRYIEMYNCLGDPSLYEASYGPPPAHDYAVGPFLSFPEQFVKDSTYNIKAAVKNLGTSNETNVPVKFFVDGSQLNSTTMSLNSGQVDSVNFPWTPASSGNFTLAIASALTTDSNRFNDTVKTTINVLPGAILTIFCDDFSSGTGNWTIVNNGGTCVWQVYNPPYPNNYTLPGTSTGGVFSADADECGSGTTLKSTATITNSINCSAKESVYLEFDNDWNAIDNQDSAIVEVSYDGGTTWSSVVAWGGTDVRNSHEVHSLPGATNNPNVKIRFRSIQPGYDWWWTVDNVCIKGFGVTGLTQQGSEIPKEYALSQNYPNPFNPVTNIKFDLPKQGHVTLKIYDILGKEVANLVNEIKPAGSYLVDFNGSCLASGVYYYRIEAGNFVNVKKMVLIK